MYVLYVLYVHTIHTIHTSKNNDIIYDDYYYFQYDMNQTGFNNSALVKVITLLLLNQHQYC